MFSLPYRTLRGHKDKIFKPSARTDVQKQFFPHRVVDSWNLLSSEITEADTVDSFLDLDLHLESGSLVGRAPELRHHTDGVHDYGAT